ncbi:MAG: FecR domain-containing protein [Candidatus Eremiobacteraeota bacterium]|nr:FecR domain-containing protein [Candidatus Eremiobacteraeota bacterium]
MSFSTVLRPIAGAFLVAVLVSPQLLAAATDKELAATKGDVAYIPSGQTAHHQIVGSQVLPDDATAVTGRKSLGTLTMPDSSEILIGELTNVTVGAFNNAAAGPGSTIKVDNGALSFKIVHPSGAKSNYTFTTPTSQIAVRGTEGYLVVGPNGTQVVCTKCEAGDVIVTVAGVATVLLTGQVFTVLGTTGATTTATTAVSQLNSSAVNQFTNGANQFGNAAASNATGTASGAAGGAAGASAGVIAGAAAAAAATGVAVAGANQSSPSPSNENVTVNPQSIVLTSAGQTQSIYASVPGTAVSANPNVASVSGGGNMFTVRAVTSGSTTVNFSAHGQIVTLRVTVILPPTPQMRPPR